MAKAKKLPPESFPLEKVIDELRGQLKTLSEKAGEKDFTFSLDEVEVELQVGLTAEGGGKIGFNCWIYQAEAEAKMSRETVQTIRLRMTPTPAVSGETSEDDSVRGQLTISDDTTQMK